MDILKEKRALPYNNAPNLYFLITYIKKPSVLKLYIN